MAGSIELALTGGVGAMYEGPAQAKNAMAPHVEQTVAPVKQEPEKKDPTEGNVVADEEGLMTDVADALNAVAKVSDRNLEFSVDKDSGRITIQVKDAETGEVIRNIPPTDIPKMRESLNSMAGLLFSEKS